MKGSPVKTFIKLLLSICMLLCGMSAATAASYTIKPGDTLSAIALRNNTTIETLLSLNAQIKNKNKIYAGHTMTIRQDQVQPRAHNSETTSVVALPKQQTRTQTAETQQLCDPVSAIAKLHYPVSIQSQLTSVVTSSLSSTETQASEAMPKIFTVSNNQEYFTFEYTENCVFSKRVGSLSHSPGIVEIAQSGPVSGSPPTPDALQPRPRNIGQGGTQIAQRDPIFLIRYRPNCVGASCADEAPGTHSLMRENE